MRLKVASYFCTHPIPVILFIVLFTTSTGFPHSNKGIIDTILGEFKELIDKTKKAEPEYYENYSTENKKIWNVYYDCLDKQLELSMILKTLPPDTLTVLEGGTARMDCELCFSPSQLINLPPNWTWTGEPLPEDDTVLVDRDTSERVLANGGHRWSGRLSVFGVRAEQAGLYECRLGSGVSRPVLLHVASPEAGLRRVKVGREGGRQLPALSASFILYSDWTPWSECSKCGKVGRHYRFGACTVRLPKGEEDATESMNEKVSLMKQWGRVGREKRDLRRKSFSAARDVAVKYNKKLRQLMHRPRMFPSIKITKTSPTKQITTPIANNNTLPETMPSVNASIGTTKSPEVLHSDVLHILELFIDGLPCTSELFPWSLRTNSIVKARKNEIMEGFCKTPCADELFEVRDKFGNILERVNNSDGVFSALQGPPPVPPVPARSSIFAATGEPLVVTCPGHLHHDVPYFWTVNRTVRLYPKHIAAQSGGRVTMDYRQRLIFKEVEPGDSRLYVCWQTDSIAGVVRVVVYDPSTVTFDHHVMLVGVTIILGAFAYLFLRIYINRLRAAAS